MAFIEFEQVSYSYDSASLALDGVDLRIDQGEFVCVLGANGSGKSTLARHMNSLAVPDAGSVYVGGFNTADAGAAFEVRKSIAMVFQNPDDQIVASIVEDDVAFGPENLGLAPKEIRERVTESLKAVGLAGFERREVSTLSGGQKQRLAIAGALAMKPHALVLDEASSMLDPRGRESLLGLCRKLNADGLTIIMITHHIHEAAQAKRIIVLADGRIQLDGAPENVLLRASELQSFGLQEPLAAHVSLKLGSLGFAIAPTARIEDLAESIAALQATIGTTDQPGTSHGLAAAVDGAIASWEPLPARKGQTGIKGTIVREVPAQSVPLLEFDAVSFAYPHPGTKTHGKKQAKRDERLSAPDAWALEEISFSVCAGEFFGIAGHTGSGKSTLIQLCNGLLQPTVGSVRVNGADLSNRASAIEARRFIGVAFQYPEHQLFAATVFDDVAFGPRNLGIDEKQIGERVAWALNLVHLDSEELCLKSPFSLSGGQQRRVALAGVLAMKPSALVLDEPVAGLDPQEKRRLIELLCELHTVEGLTIVLVSHEMQDLSRLCDRILVLNQGGMHALGTPESIFTDETALRKIGLDLPDRYRLVHALDGQMKRR